MIPPQRSHREAGYTMAELLIASSVLGVFAVVIAMASAFSGREMGRLRDRATSAIEMRSVVEHLRRDLGAADRIDSPGFNRLRIRRDDVAARLAGYEGKGTDPGVEYRLTEGVLRRVDNVYDTAVVISTGLRSFQIEEAAGGGDVHITIETGTKAAGHRIALQWIDEQ